MEEKMSSNGGSEHDISDKKYLVSDEEATFAKMYTKLCPVRLFTGANWFLLLIMLVISLVALGMPLDHFDRIRDWDRMPIMLGILLVLNLMPKALKWASARQQWSIPVPILGVLALCFSWITVVCMVVVCIFYAIQSNNIFGDFSPQFFTSNFTDPDNETQTKAAAAEEDDELTNYYYKRHEYRPRYYHGKLMYPYEIEQLKSIGTGRVLLHAILNPTMSFFSIVSLLLNLFIAIYLFHAITSSKIWLRNYRDQFPDCAEFDAKYAEFLPYGLLKMIRWIFPTFFVLLSIFARFYEMDAPMVILMGILTSISFFEWTLYVQKAKLRLQKSTPAKSMITHALWDNVFSLATIIFYFVLSMNTPYYIRGFGEKLFYTGLAISSTLLISTTVLICKKGGSLTGANGYFALPQISIQISVNVIKNEAKDEKLAKDVQNEEKEVAKE